LVGIGRGYLIVQHDLSVSQRITVAYRVPVSSDTINRLLRKGNLERVESLYA
jgi:hypothetical protein